MSVEIDGQDVIKLVLQFLKENSLNQSLGSLQSESQVFLNAVANPESFKSDVLKGNWDRVLNTCRSLRIPTPKLVTLHEQIVLEMMEIGEMQLARSILAESEVLLDMKKDHPDRYLRLQHQANKSQVDANDIYPDGMNKEKTRAKLAGDLMSEVVVVPPSRLLSLLNQSIKWQQHQGLLPPGSMFDAFRGTALARPDEADTVPSSKAALLKLGSKTYCECSAFSPDGQFFVTGSVDGFIEVWDMETGKLRKDLQYQADDKFMMHKTPVISCSFSRDGDYLATGSQDGRVKVWKIRTGQCMRKLEGAHSQGVTSLMFAKDPMHLVTCSYDNLIRKQGLKSGRMLNELRGHSSYVNHATYTHDFARIVSGSSDGTVKVWDAKTGDCLNTFRPTPVQVADVPICYVGTCSKYPDQIVAATRGKCVYISNLAGKILRTITLPDHGCGQIVSCRLSRTAKYVYILSDCGKLHAANYESGDIETHVEVSQTEPLGFELHPHRNMIATWCKDGLLQMWTT